MKIKMMKKEQVIAELDKLGYELDLNELTTKDLAEILCEVNSDLDVEVLKRRSKDELISDLNKQGVEVELDSLEIKQLKDILRKVIDKENKIKEKDLPIDSEKKDSKKKKLVIPAGFFTKTVTVEDICKLDKDKVLYGWDPISKIAIIKEK